MPSERHIQLQNMTARWIGNRSFKICGLPESHVVGYIADFVAIAGLHDQYHTRYAHHSQLEKMYMSSRLTDKGWEQKIFGDIDRWYVCVFEVKVSRADFLNTFGNKTTPHAFAFDMLWLSMNCRVSYYDQLIAMAEKAKNLHRAIMANKPNAELLRRSQQLMKSCKGLEGA